MKNISKMVDFKLFFYTEKTLSKRGQMTANFLFQYQTFYHILYPQTCQETTAEAIFEFSLCALKTVVLIVGRKVLTYLVTFKFRGTHFCCNRIGNLNGKILNNNTKNNNCTLQYIYISDISISDKIGIYKRDVSFVAQYISELMAKVWVLTNNQRERVSWHRIWGGLDNVCHIVRIALLEYNAAGTVRTRL